LEFSSIQPDEEPCRAYITRSTSIEGNLKPRFASKHVAAKFSRIQMQMASRIPEHLCHATLDSMGIATHQRDYFSQ